MKNIIDRILGTARTSLPTVKADGKEVELLLDGYGKLATTIYNGSNTPLSLDENGHAIVVSHVEDAIHVGEHYYISGFATLGNNAGVDDTLYVKLVTPDTAIRVHFRWEINAGGILETNFWEGASGGMTGGTGVTPINNNRNSDSTSDIVITSGVTVATSKGTLLDPVKVGGTGFKSVVGGNAGMDDEIILKQDTTYFREFISTSENNIITFRALWVEK